MFRPVLAVLVALLINLPTTLYGQTKIEQLRLDIQGAKTLPGRLEAILAFCDAWESYSPDTLKKYSEEARLWAKRLDDAVAAQKAEYYRAVWLFQVNKLDSAQSLVDQVIRNYRKYPYDHMFTKLAGLKSNILLRTKKMDELLAHNFEWMKETEKARDTMGIARAALGIGNVHSRLKKYDETLKWYRHALSLMQNDHYKRKLSFLFNNMAVIFYHLNREDSAMYYIKKGIHYSREDGNLTNLANALSLQGGLQAEFGHLEEAEQSFKQQLEVRRQIGDVYYLIVDMAQLALFYANTKEPQKGIAICKDALELAKKNGNDFQSLTSIYSSLSKAYLAAGDHKGYGDALYEQMALKDSIYTHSSAEAMAEMQAKYELQKKETTIAQQQLSLISKNYQLYGSLLLLFLVMLFSYILFRQYRRKQSLKMQLLKEEEKRRAEKAVADAEEAERKRIAADLHDSLGAYAASIVSNIDHLSADPSMQGNLQPLQELKNNSMSIVSQLGDTIWALKKDALSLTALSDRIKVFIHRIQASYPHITIDVNENIEREFLIAPSQAFHLFQIVKEAVNNAVRHSHGSSLVINIISRENWKIQICDDGEGMTGQRTLAEGGNGLLNMKSRALESGWNIEWHSNRPRGTEVIIEPTTN